MDEISTLVIPDDEIYKCFEVFQNKVVTVVNSGKPADFFVNNSCCETSPCLSCLVLGYFTDNENWSPIKKSSLAFENKIVFQKCGRMKTSYFSSEVFPSLSASKIKKCVISDPKTNSALINIYINRTFSIRTIPELFSIRYCRDMYMKISEHSSETFDVPLRHVIKIFEQIISTLYDLQTNIGLNLGMYPIKKLLFVKKPCVINFLGKEISSKFTVKFSSFSSASMIVNGVQYKTRKLKQINWNLIKQSEKYYTFTTPEIVRTASNEFIGFDIYWIFTEFLLVPELNVEILKNDKLRKCYEILFEDQLDDVILRVKGNYPTEEILSGFRLSKNAPSDLVGYLFGAPEIKKEP